MNNGYSGAYLLFKEKGYEKGNVGVWMHRAGYRTMMIGKYSHGRMNPVDLPGWDDFAHLFWRQLLLDFQVCNQIPVGQRRNVTRPDEYRTVVEADEAVRMLVEHRKRISLARKEKARTNLRAVTSAGNRFSFIWLRLLRTFLPAKTEMLQQEYVDFAKGLRMELTPDLNEEDVSDKPKHLQIPKLTDAAVESLHEEHRRRLSTIKSIDDMMGKLMEGLKANEFDKTPTSFSLQTTGIS